MSMCRRYFSRSTYYLVWLVFNQLFVLNLAFYFPHLQLNRVQPSSARLRDQKFRRIPNFPSSFPNGGLSPNGRPLKRLTTSLFASTAVQKQQQRRVDKKKAEEESTSEETATEVDNRPQILKDLIAEIEKPYSLLLHDDSVNMIPEVISILESVKSIPSYLVQVPCCNFVVMLIFL